MECGECTACCTAFPVKELKKPIATECDYADEGCKIYNDRPQSCQDCLCAWITQPVAVLELRPDKCGVIFERNKDIMIGTVIGPITPIIQGQIEDFKKQGFKVIMQKVKK